MEHERAPAQTTTTIASSLSLAERVAKLNWPWFLAQIGLVVGVELTDDLAHVLVAQNNFHTALANATGVVHFETIHDFWIEPAVQQFFMQTHYVLGRAIGSAQTIPVFNTLYGPGHVLLTLAFAVWIYLYRRPLFSFLRNIFLITNALAVVLYETFPLAPPRLVDSLRFDGHSYRFTDMTFGAGNGLRLSFNEFAAMPSIHVGWALIVGLTLAWAARPLAVRVLALMYPVLMLVTVIVTGNHYISDGLGAAAVLAIAVLVSLLLEWRRNPRVTFAMVVRHMHAHRHRRAFGSIGPDMASQERQAQRSAA